MANRSMTLYSHLDMRHYMDQNDMGLIFDDTNAKYNGLGWQTFGDWGTISDKRTWGNVIKKQEIIVKASTLSVGAPKPQRNTQGWNQYGGNIPKMGHGVSIDEDDLLTMREISAIASGEYSAEMRDLLVAKSEVLVGGIHNKLTSWTYEVLSTGYIKDAIVDNPDGITLDLDFKIGADHRVRTTASWGHVDEPSGRVIYNEDADPIGDLVEAQKIAKDKLHMSFSHWVMTKYKYDMFINHPAVLKKCQSRVLTLSPLNYSLVESDVMRIAHDFGVLPIYVIDEKSAIEVDGIPQLCDDSFEKDTCALVNGFDLFEVKCANSVYVDAARRNPDKNLYHFIDGRMAVVDMWNPAPVKNIIEIELWGCPVLKNPQNILLLDTLSDADRA